MPDVTLGQFKQFLSRKLSDEDYGAAITMLRDVLSGGAAEDQETGLPRPGGAMDSRPRYAMDSRMPGRIVADREVAIAECESTVPRSLLIGCDSAESVFRAALRHMGNPQPREYPASGLAVLFRETRRAQLGGSARGAAHDSAAYSSFAQKYPDAAKIRVLG